MQEWGFRNGFSWVGGNYFKYLTEEFLYFEDGLICYGNKINTFINESGIEIFEPLDTVEPYYEIY
jgi:hypothetical protein